jgi:sugar lactone lactonase YvrE
MKINESRNKREGHYAGKRMRGHRREGAPLPDGLAIDMMGSLWARCRSCENVYEYLGERHQFTQDMSYCFGSDRCLP